MFSGVKTYFYGEPNKCLSLRNIFKPLYIVLSLFGLFPYSVKFDNKRGLTIIRKSIYLNALCAVCYILFMIAFLGLHIRFIIFDDTSEESDSESATEDLDTDVETNFIIELVISLLVCFSIYISAYKNRGTFVKIINDIANMIGPTNANVEHILKLFRFQVNVVIMGFLCVVLMLQICVNFSSRDSLWKKILVGATCILPQLIQFTMLCFYYVLILMLVSLLMHIRLQITDIVKNKANVLDFGMTADTKILTLQYLEALYVRAFEVKEIINDAFAAPIIVTSIQCFHAMVSEAHILYHGVAIEKDFEVHPIVNCSIWILYQMTKIIIMSNSATLLKQEVRKIGIELHNIPTQTHDFRLLMEIQHFSSLMSYQSDEITAYGLFVVDPTLLSKIISSSAMYMIILIQFD